MKTCNCGDQIPSSVVIEGKRRNLKNRTKCFNCVPFGSSQFSKKSPEDRRSYNAQKAKRHYNKAKERNGGIDPIKIHREQRKKLVVKAIGGKCQLCGYNKLDRNLAFHHIRDKELHLDSRAFQRSWTKIIPEILKCVLVCHNCHGEIHAGIIELPIIQKMNHEVFHSLKDFKWTGSSAV